MSRCQRASSGATSAPASLVSCVLSHRADDRRQAVREIVRAAVDVATELGWLETLTAQPA